MSVLSEQTRQAIKDYAKRYPHPNSALLPALQAAQREKGWLSQEVIEEVAELLGLPPTKVGSVASFYSMLFRKPVGRHIIYLCTNVSCSLRGSERILEYIKGKLGIEVGETTPDGMFTLLTVECLGACDRAPMMQVDETYYGPLTEEEVDRILESLRSEGLGSEPRPQSP